MNILKFLAKNWDSVIVVIGFFAFCLALIKKGQTKILKNILFGLVTQAEKQFGSGTGSLKFATVADWIYQRIPLILRVLFTRKDIEEMIETTLEIAKGAWSSNENIQDYIRTKEKDVIIKEIEKDPDKKIQEEPQKGQEKDKEKTAE